METYHINSNTLLRLTEDPGEFYKTEFNIWLNGQPTPIISLFRECQTTGFSESERETLASALQRFTDFLDRRLRSVRDFRVRWIKSRSDKDTDLSSISDLIEEASTLRILEGPVASRLLDQLSSSEPPWIPSPSARQSADQPAPPAVVPCHVRLVFYRVLRRDRLVIDHLRLVDRRTQRRLLCHSSTRSRRR